MNRLLGPLPVGDVLEDCGKLPDPGGVCSQVDPLVAYGRITLYGYRLAGYCDIAEQFYPLISRPCPSNRSVCTANNLLSRTLKE